MRILISLSRLLYATRFGFWRQSGQIGGLFGAGFACSLFIYLFSRVWVTHFGVGEHEKIVRACWYTLIGEIGLFSFGRAQMIILRDSLRQDAAYQALLPQSWILLKLAELWGMGLFLSCGLAITPCLLLTVFFGYPSDLNTMEVICFFISYAIAGGLRCLIVMLVSCFSFWINKTDAVFWLYSQLSLLAGVIMPLSFYPTTIQNLAWCTPLPMLAHIPASMLLYSEDAGLAGWDGCLAITAQILWLVVLILATHASYSLGTRHHFESSN